jgi:HIV Tat-specific factor 1
VVSVTRAKFQMKGEAYDPQLKPKKLRKKELEKLKRQREKLFAWIPDKLKGERYKHEKVIVIRNLFDPEEFDRDPGRILDYTSRIRAQCSKFGTITKLTLYDKVSFIMRGYGCLSC